MNHVFMKDTRLGTLGFPSNAEVMMVHWIEKSFLVSITVPDYICIDKMQICFSKMTTEHRL